ncbi:MAG: RHS repeat protein, partial [Burkholderiales bacterium]|nr:RHS repeat protein [Burkholderiales bacterium]
MNAVLDNWQPTSLEQIIVSKNDQDQTTSYSYNSRNQVKLETGIDGTLTQYDYDAFGKLRTVRRAAGSSDERGQSLQYDAFGHVLAELSPEGVAKLASGANAADVWANYAVHYTYNSLGQRTSSVDQNQHTTLAYFDSVGRQIYKVNAEGEVQETQYNAMGQVARSRSYAARLPKEQISVANYDTLLATLKTWTASDTLTPNDVQQKFYYDKQGQLILGNDGEKIDTRIEYNAFGQVTSNRRQAKDASIFVVSSDTYDRRGNLLQHSPYGNAGIAVYNQYDAFNRLTHHTLASGNYDDIAYDHLGHVTFAIAQHDKNYVGPQTKTSYDAFGHVLTQTDGNGNITQYQYDRASRSMTVTTVTHFEYDAANRVFTRTVDPTGLKEVTKYSYDSRGQTLSVTDPRGIVTASQYTRNGQLKSVTVDAGDGQDGTAHLNLTTTFEYDSRGNKAKVTDPNQHVTLYELSSNGVCTTVTQDPITAQNPKGLNLRVQEFRNAENKIYLRAVGPDGSQQYTRFIYDNFGRVAYEVDPAGAVTGYVYDNNTNQLLKTIHYANTIDLDGTKFARFTDSKPQTWSSQFIIGDVESLLKTDNTRDVIERTLYDKDGRVYARISGNGTVTINKQFDAKGRVIEQITYAKEQLQAPYLNPLTIEMLNNKLIETGVPDAAHDLRTLYVYDARGRAVRTLSSAGVTSDGKLQWSVMAQEFDGNGNVTLRRACSDFLLSDANGAAPSEEAINAFISSRVNLGPVANDGLSLFHYDAANRLLGSAIAQGPGARPNEWAWAFTEYFYDKGGNLILRQNRRDAISMNMYAQTDMRNGHSYQAEASHTKYVYDNANRLTATMNQLWLNNWIVVQQTYDKVGNVVQKTAYANSATTPEYAYSDPDSTALLASITPDAARDRITRFAYDNSNRLAVTVDGAGAVTRQVYNALGDVVQVKQFANVVTDQTQLKNLSANFEPPASAMDRVSRTVYDNDHRPLYSVDALGFVTAKRYDGLGRVVASVRYATAINPNAISVNSKPAEIAALIKADATQDRIERNVYDNAGRLAWHLDALGYFTHYVYDAQGRVISTTAFPQAFNSNGKNYDALGQSQLRADVEAQAATQWNTINQNRATAAKNKTTVPAAEDYRTQSTSYDAQGRVISTTDALGVVTAKYTYDALGNKKTYTNALQATWTYDYDMLGHLVQTRTPEVDVYSSMPASDTDTDWHL